MLGLCCCTRTVSSCGAGAPHELRGSGCSLRWLPFLWSMALGCMGFGSCRTWAHWLWCMNLVAPWHVRYSQTRLESTSPALRGGFLTPGLPGKSLTNICTIFYSMLVCVTLFLFWKMDTVVDLRMDKCHPGAFLVAQW